MRGGEGKGRWGPVLGMLWQVRCCKGHAFRAHADVSRRQLQQLSCDAGSHAQHMCQGTASSTSGTGSNTHS